MTEHSDQPNSMNPMGSEDFIRQLSLHQPRIFAFINALLPNTADAEEVMQETSLILWRKWGQFRPDADFRRWACGIARYEVLRYRRQHAKSRVFLGESLIEQIASMQLRQAEDAVAHEAARQEALRSCLNKLKPSDRKLIEQRYWAKTTTCRFADELGRPVSTVYQALSRIRGWLFGCIERTLAREEHV